MIEPKVKLGMLIVGETIDRVIWDNTKLSDGEVIDLIMKYLEEEVLEDAE